jgi:soluble lytic murein transglycosylase
MPPGVLVRDIAWRLCYPRAFGPAVAAAAADLEMDPALILAIMRNESGFRPSVVSIAHALGLMQVLYRTAIFTATKLLKMKALPFAKVFEPSVNVRIGARYLKELIALFDGNAALAMAGYNAGPYNVVHWLDARRGLDTDEFIEEIPILETYGYTKKVFASWAAYRYLYGGSDPAAADTPLPAKVPAKLGMWMGKRISKVGDLTEP